MTGHSRMSTQIALLRAVNVAGHGKVAMSDVRSCLEALGFTGVRTVLQSGNVTFRGDGPTGATLEALLEAEFLKRLDLRTTILVRSARHWASLITANPLADEARRDPSHLLAMVAKRPVTP